MSETVADEPLAAVASDLRKGEFRPTAYVERLRERFASVEPAVRAFLDERGRWDRLDREARALEARFGEPGTRPPLYGVPVGIKDIVHVDGFETRAGSDVPPHELTGDQAPVATALREAGALVLGKTVTAEFAYFDPGPTRNPRALERTPGGSSSGSAAAVAAGLAPLAIGTQTIGSVNRPAAFCGIVGVTPSAGRVPTDGVVPAAPSVDRVGYFTQDLAGARLAAGVLYDDWRADCRTEDVETVGVVDGPYLTQASETGREHFRRHVDALDREGFDVRRVEAVPEIEAVNDRHERLVAAEMALSHSDLCPAYGDRYAAETVELIEEGRATGVGELCDARAGRADLRAAIHDRMADRDLDAIVSPAAPGPAPEGLDSTGDPIMNLPWSHAGLPAVTLPASETDDGLPMGLQVVGRHGEDERLLAGCERIAGALA